MTFRMDPRAKLYLLLLANLLLLFHVGTAAEAATTVLCLLLFFLSGKIGMGLRLSALYFGLLAVDIFVVPRAGEGVLLNLLSLVSVGVRMMLPCIITGAYAFSTTTIGELTARDVPAERLCYGGSPIPGDWKSPPAAQPHPQVLSWTIRASTALRRCC